jgi:competence protein ComEA
MAKDTVTDGTAVRVRATLGGALRWAGASPWAKVLGRAAFALLAIVVLAGIGRASGARTGEASEAYAGNDAGADAGGEEESAYAHREAGAGVVTVDPSMGVRTNIEPSATPRAGAASAGVGAGARATPEAPVRLNLADEAELRRLPGVGPKRAQAILALRARVGRFQRLEDLLRVKGVGRATLKKWRPLVTLGTSSTTAQNEDGGAA